MKKILIIIPVINEFENLVTLLPLIESVNPYVHVCVINDASTDLTQTLCDEKLLEDPKKFFAFHRTSRLGIGSAHILGINFAVQNNYDFLISMDGDLTHHPKYISELIREAEKFQYVDLVIGSRFIKNSKIYGWKFTRRILTKLGHLFTQIKFRLTFDMSSGLRLYRVSTIPKKLLEDKLHNGYDFFPYSVFLYSSENLNISEIPVNLYPRLKGKSKLTLFESIKSIWRIIMK